MVDLIINYFVKYLFYPIIIGVVSTAFYVLIFDVLIKKIWLPWYFSKKYKSTKIDGFWKGETSTFSFDVTMKQTGDKVAGDILARSFRMKDSKKEMFESNNYIFNGEIKDGFVRLIYKEKNRNSFGFGCFIFQIAGGGKTLNGSVVFVNEGENMYSVSTHENIKLKREN